MAFIITAKFNSTPCACGARFAIGSKVAYEPNNKRGTGRPPIVGCESCRQPEALWNRRGVATGPAATVTGTVEKVLQRWASGTGIFTVRPTAPLGDVVPIDAVNPTYGTVSVKGSLDNAKPGALVEIHGRWQNGKYGTQLAATEVNASMDAADPRGATRFFESFSGIGPARAQRIVDHLGGPDAALAAITNDPESLADVPGVPADVAEQLVEQALTLTPGYRKARAYCAALGLGPVATKRALDTWGSEIETVVAANPYTLMVLPRIGWSEADRIAAKLGITGADPRRLKAAALYVLTAAQGDGHCYVTREALVLKAAGRAANDAMQTVGLDVAQICDGLQLGCEPYTAQTKGGPRQRDGLVLDIEGKFWARELHDAELTAARHVRRIAGASVAPATVTDADIAGLDDDQARAVLATATEAIVVVTGGPGTGKTHTSNAVLSVARKAGQGRIGACAPTGKAALRLKEQIGSDAFTIHRTLGFMPGDDDTGGELQGEWKFNEHNPLDVDVVLADEASMVDVRIAARLLAAVPTGARLVIVGDVDQLPSVGPGAVLHDIIESGCVTVARLRTIHRQASDSGIPYVARAINEGRDAQAVIAEAHDVDFADIDDAEGAADAIVEAATSALPQQLGCAPIDVQVLAPMKAGPCGVRKLNARIQAVLCPNPTHPAAAVFVGGGDDEWLPKAAPRDRVIQTRNDYNLLIWNGEIGEVVVVDRDGVDMYDRDDVRTRARAESWTAKNGGERSFNHEDFDAGAPESDKHPIVMIVRYGHNGTSRCVGYTAQSARDLHLAYALTIHKSQGSQWKAIVMPVHKSHGRMLTRALVYTGVTRAESRVVMFGQPGALKRASITVRDKTRMTGLQDRLTATAAPDGPSGPPGGGGGLGLLHDHDTAVTTVGAHNAEQARTALDAVMNAPIEGTPLPVDAHAAPWDTDAPIAPYSPLGLPPAPQAPAAAPPTHCCICGRPLDNDASVEVGIGPVCEKKYGLDNDEARGIARQLSAMYSAKRAYRAFDADTAVRLCRELKGLGCVQAAYKAGSKLGVRVNG